MYDKRLSLQGNLLSSYCYIITLLHYYIISLFHYFNLSIFLSSHSSCFPDSLFCGIDFLELLLSSFSNIFA